MVHLWIKAPIWDRLSLPEDDVSRRSHEVEQDLNQTLTALRAYGRRDPQFNAAIAAAAKAEAKDGQSDPLGGEAAVGERVEGRVA